MSSRSQDQYEYAKEILRKIFQSSGFEDLEYRLSDIKLKNNLIYLELAFRDVKPLFRRRAACHGTCKGDGPYSPTPGPR